MATPDAECLKKNIVIFYKIFLSFSKLICVNFTYGRMIWTPEAGQTISRASWLSIFRIESVNGPGYNQKQIY